MMRPAVLPMIPHMTRNAENPVPTTCKKYLSATALTALLTTGSAMAAYSELSCKLGILEDLGWRVAATDTPPAVLFGNSCEHTAAPVFTYNPTVETNSIILDRVNRAVNSTTSRCLVNRRYADAIKTAIVNLTDNKEFTFLSGGADPRDPFTPPDNSWVAVTDKGYDEPATSLSEGINALYKKPFVAECAAATQIAQLAILKEHYGIFTDAIIQPGEVGIGIWPAYVKAPSIAANKPLLLDSSQRKRALKTLAVLGKGAFYNQSGYLRPYKGDKYVDSIDNRGQNFVIVDVYEDALDSMRSRSSPMRDYNRITRDIWKKYRRRMTRDRTNKEVLSEEMRAELEAIDPFFSDVMVYVHPLSVRNFAFHIARQFKWNSRTPYVLEIYEDFQSGYFHERYIDYRLQQCLQNAYCRKAGRDHYYLTDETGIADKTVYSSPQACAIALEKLTEVKN